MPRPPYSTAARESSHATMVFRFILRLFGSRTLPEMRFTALWFNPCNGLISSHTPMNSRPKSIKGRISFGSLWHKTTLIIMGSEESFSQHFLFKEVESPGEVIMQPMLHSGRDKSNQTDRS